MAIERQGPEAVSALREKYGLPPQRTTSESKRETSNEIQAPAKATEVDPIEFYHELFSLVVEKEPLGKEALIALAGQRTEAIISEMVSVDGVDQARFSILDPSIVEKRKSDTVSAKLEITAQK